MTRTPPIAWHGSAALKAEAVTRMHTHREADAIIQGIYQEIDPTRNTGYRGCLVGCLIPPIGWTHDGQSVRPSEGWHEAVERKFGIDRRVAHLFDSLFELLPEHDCAEFAVNSLVAVPVGADLTHAPRLWAADVVTNARYGLNRFVPLEAVEIVNRVVRLLRDDGSAEAWKTTAQRLDNASTRLANRLGADALTRPEPWALQAIAAMTLAPRIDHNDYETDNEHGWRYVAEDAVGATRIHDDHKEPYAFAQWMAQVLLRHVAEAPVPGVWSKRDEQSDRWPLLARIGEPPC